MSVLCRVTVPKLFEHKDTLLTQDSVTDPPLVKNCATFLHYLYKTNNNNNKLLQSQNHCKWIHIFLRRNKINNTEKNNLRK